MTFSSELKIGWFVFCLFFFFKQIVPWGQSDLLHSTTSIGNPLTLSHCMALSTHNICKMHTTTYCSFQFLHMKSVRNSLEIHLGHVHAGLLLRHACSQDHIFRILFDCIFASTYHFPCMPGRTHTEKWS